MVSISLDDTVASQVWSLFDVLEELKTLLACRDEIAKQRKEFSKQDQTALFPVQSRGELVANLERWKAVCERHGFNRASHTAAKLHKSKLQKQTYRDLARELNEIAADLHGDLISRFVFIISAERQVDYGAGFGKSIAKAFPAAAEEIEKPISVTHWIDGQHPCFIKCVPLNMGCAHWWSL